MPKPKPMASRTCWRASWPSSPARSTSGTAAATSSSLPVPACVGRMRPIGRSPSRVWPYCNWVSPCPIPGSRDEQLIACPSMRGSHASYWSFPIQGVALLQLGFAVPYPWLPRELAMLHAAGARCFEAMERVRMQGEVRRLEAEAHRAEEAERRRIGRDLHDEAGQSLVLLRLQLEMMEKDAPPALRQRLEQARLIAERTVGELRRTIGALSPAVVERLGLEAALRQLAARCRQQQSADV